MFSLCKKVKKKKEKKKKAEAERHQILNNTQDKQLIHYHYLAFFEAFTSHMHISAVFMAS